MRIAHCLIDNKKSAKELYKICPLFWAPSIWRGFHHSFPWYFIRYCLENTRFIKLAVRGVITP